jgi:hypothetical protein
VWFHNERVVREAPPRDGSIASSKFLLHPLMGPLKAITDLNSERLLRAHGNNLRNYEQLGNS